MPLHVTERNRRFQLWRAEVSHKAPMAQNVSSDDVLLRHQNEPIQSISLIMFSSNFRYFNALPAEVHKALATRRRQPCGAPAVQNVPRNLHGTGCTPREPSEVVRSCTSAT